MSATKIRVALAVAAAFIPAVVLAFIGAVPRGETNQNYRSIGTAPVGGAFQAVGSAISDVLNEERGNNAWKFNPKGTKGSQENIRRLSQGEIDFAMSNAAITYFAVRGEQGWEKQYEPRVVVTLAPNVAMFITTEGSGVKTIQDLAGQRVVVGPAGAGFQMFVRPIVEEHGVDYDSITELNATQSAAVDMLADGQAAACFLGGGPPPTASITQACSSLDVFFIPYDEEVMKTKLFGEKYPFFKPFEVSEYKKDMKTKEVIEPKRKIYSDLNYDYAGMNVGSMHFITSAAQDEELVYQVTKTIWQYRDQIAKKHPAANAIKLFAVLDTGTPYHPGAIRFYEEVGLWKFNGKPVIPPPAAAAADAKLKGSTAAL